MISRRWGNEYLYSLLVERPDLRFEQYFDKKNCFHSFSFQFFWSDVVFNHQLRTCHKLTGKLRREVILGSSSIDDPAQYITVLKCLPFSSSEECSLYCNFV